MSNRARDVGGVFGALLHAVVGLGAAPAWAELPPTTAPGSLGRALGQGLLHGRLPRDARGACVGNGSRSPPSA